jgi:dUTP pyrophosphatase
MRIPKVKIYLEEGVSLPEYNFRTDAGADIRSNEPTFGLYPSKTKLVGTGIYLQIPEGYECQVRPRSGLAMKHGITVLNSPGTIDSSYRGEVKVLLINHGNERLVIEKGMRIAQLVFAKHARALFDPVEKAEDLEETTRGDGGFGHTGL